MSSVVETCECPSSPETVATSAPPEIIRLAAVCLRLWTFRSRGRPCFLRINLNRQVKVLGVMGRSAPWRRKIKHHPEKVSEPALKNLEPLSHGWDRDWRDKVIRFQIPLFSPETKGGWVLRFDDILADALELGPLRSPTIFLPPGLEQRLANSFPSAKPEVLLTLLEYYVANKQEDSPWVVLPVANFDAYFGTTAFSKKWLAKIPAAFMERQNQHFGVCRYRVRVEWVEGVKMQW